MDRTVHVKNASLCYQHETLFSSLNHQFSAGRWTSILGPSGVGKSSLLRLIAGLVDSKKSSLQGSVSYTTGQSLQGDIALMPQQDALMPWLSVLDNVLLPTKLCGIKVKNYQQRAIHLLEQVGLGAMAARMPDMLSGGQRQRVSLARALLLDKPIVLLDEPFSALDAITRHQLQNQFVQLLDDKTVLMVTHDPVEALRVSDTVLVMSGRPATLNTTITLTSERPRPLDHPDVRCYEGQILDALLGGAV